MGELTQPPKVGNVNVTLEAGASLSGHVLPCPVCGMGLPFRISRKAKPYCVCDSCGIQIFFRGKRGISRLSELARAEILIPAREGSSSSAVTLYNRLQQLKLQKEELEAKRGIIFTDEDLENAIKAVDREIKTVQGELEELGRKSLREKKE